MRPEWALLGTRTTSPKLDWEMRTVGELRAMRAFQRRGKATTMPRRTDVPLISSSPCWETRRGLVEQLATGTHLAPVIRTVEPPAGAEAPPVTAPAGGGIAITDSEARTNVNTPSSDERPLALVG